MKNIFLPFVLVGFGSSIVQAQNKSRFEKEIVDVEMAFSKDSKELGFIAANLKYAADDALVFRPGIINAKEWSNKLKGTDSAYRITWYPSFIETASAGDLGVAIGPFDNVSTIKGDTSENHGQFLTIWKRQEDGSLKFVMDFGSNQLPRSEFVKKEPAFQPATKARVQYKSTDQQIQAEAILEIEKDFANECAINGEINAYKKYAYDDLRFFYQRQFYARGLNNAISRIAEQKGRHTWKSSNAVVAQSGDLAYVYGTHEYKESETLKSGYYLRIWKKKAGKWVLIAQVRSLLG